MKNYLDDDLINKINKKCKIKKYDKFDVIVIDPPWNQGKTSHRGVRPNQGKNLDYDTTFHLLDIIHGLHLYPI